MENLILKTGFDNSINNSSQSEEYELQMMSLMTVFMENAVKTAEIYTKHSNRKTITSIDILLGLKKEVFTFLDNDDIEERALAIFNKFKNEDFLIVKKKMKKMKMKKMKKMKKMRKMKKMEKMKMKK